MCIATTACERRPVMSIELIGRLKALKLHGMAWHGAVLAGARHQGAPQ